MLALLALALASERFVLYDRKSVPPGWQISSRAHSKQRVSFILALPQNKDGVEALERTFWEVADPRSPSYQAFLEPAQIDAIVGASPEHGAAVKKWLELYLPHALVKVLSDAVVVKGAQVEQIEKIFETTLFTHTHTNGHTIIRCQGPYSIPTTLKDHVDFVEGIADFPMHRSPSRRSPSAPQNAMVVPDSLASMYGFKDVPAPKLSKQMPAEFQGDASFSPSDLDHFLKDNSLSNENVSHIVGPFNDQFPDTEATLDVQYIVGVSPGVTDWYWTSDGWMYTFATNLANSKSVPSTVSMSWGWSEAQQCTINDGSCKTLGVDNQQYVARTNVEFMKIGLRGVSVFASSGDSGANGRSDGECTDSVLHAVFPASSPYVTAVGATQMQTVSEYLKTGDLCKSTYQCVAKGVEEAVSVNTAGFTSGGGFSNYTARPSYQDKAVDAYLKSSVKMPPASYFNAKGRAFPDVAALGNNFLIYIDVEGGWSPVGGTSASSPTWAGIAARLNDVSLQKTGKNLGFMNPLLYQIWESEPAAFHDVVTGDNKCTEDGCFSSCKGFEATKGWDAVTGLGTPDYAVLVQHLSQMLDARKGLIA